MTLTHAFTTASANAPAPRLPVPAPRVPAWLCAARVGDDATYDTALARRYVHLQGCLDDLYSEYEDAAQAIIAGRGEGFCGALGALQARLASCVVSMTAVEAQLMALDGLPRRGPSPILA